jgi:hypothetical protein
MWPIIADSLDSFEDTTTAAVEDGDAAGAGAGAGGASIVAPVPNDALVPNDAAMPSAAAMASDFRK